MWPLRDLPWLLIFLCAAAVCAGVGGAKFDNVSSEMCRHPCEELVDLLTEIHGLRIVTSNLLEDLDRVTIYEQFVLRQDQRIVTDPSHVLLTDYELSPTKSRL